MSANQPETTLGDVVKMTILGVVMAAGMLCPVTAYYAYKFGTGNVRSVDAGAERRAGRLEMCLYFAQKANVSLAEAEPACESLSVEMGK